MLYNNVAKLPCRLELVFLVYRVFPSSVCICLVADSPGTTVRTPLIVEEKTVPCVCVGVGIVKSNKKPGRNRDFVEGSIRVFTARKMEYATHSMRELRTS